MNNIQITVRDARAAYNNARNAIEQSGGTLTGTAMAGSFNASAVRGNYRLIGNKAFGITITKKPFIYPEKVIKDKIQSFFDEGGF